MIEVIVFLPEGNTEVYQYSKKEIFTTEDIIGVYFDVINRSLHIAYMTRDVHYSNIPFKVTIIEK